MKLRGSGGHCDFCGEGAKQYARSEYDSDRDICYKCTMEAFKLFPDALGVPTKTKETTSMLNAFIKRLVDKDVKTLIKAGFMNSDMTLTAEGEGELMALLLEKSKKELVTSAEEVIQERKEDAKK